MENNQNINQNYLVLAIVAAIFGCCSFYGIGFVIGVIAIVFAAQVNSKARMGDYVTANKYSEYAKKLSIISIGIAMFSMVFVAYQIKTHPEIIEQVKEVVEEAQKEQQSVHDSYQRGYEEGQKKAEELLNAKEQN